MNAVLDESLVATLPQLFEQSVSSTSNTNNSAIALFDAVSEAVFEIARPTLDTLYAALCAEPDALYSSQLIEMRLLLPQHMGLRRELYLMPTCISIEHLASLWRPSDELLPSTEAAALLRWRRTPPPQLRSLRWLQRL